MIISHSHKFILLKSIKTAGTSIEAALSTYCSGEDIVTPLNQYSFNRDKASGVEHHPMNAEKLEWWDKETIGQHVDANMLKKNLPRDIWENYLKISISRNPWDRLVSLFTWRNKNNNNFKPKKRFYHYFGFPYAEFSQMRKHFSNYAKSEWETNDRFYMMDNELCVDYVIRYESLTESFNGLCDRLQLERIALPQLKTGIRPTQHHYSDYYDEETKEIVAVKHQNDIRLFGYTFDQQRPQDRNSL
jgi:hypothetical protein